MTDAELDELLRLSAEGSPSPWDACGESAIENQHGRHHFVGNDTSAAQDAKNAALACAARNALDRLVAEVRQLRAILYSDALEDREDLRLAYERGKLDGVAKAIEAYANTPRGAPAEPPPSLASFMKMCVEMEEIFKAVRGPHILDPVT